MGLIFVKLASSLSKILKCGTNFPDTILADWLYVADINVSGRWERNWLLFFVTKPIASNHEFIRE